jgi:hypothetical protein
MSAHREILLSVDTSDKRLDSWPNRPTVEKRGARPAGVGRAPLWSQQSESGDLDQAELMGLTHAAARELAGFPLTAVDHRQSASCRCSRPSVVTDRRPLLRGFRRA